MRGRSTLWLGRHQARAGRIELRQDSGILRGILRIRDQLGEVKDRAKNAEAGITQGYIEELMQNLLLLIVQG
jgi:hypothetical protein